MLHNPGTALELLKTTKMVVGAPYSRPKQLSVVIIISKMVKVIILGPTRWTHHQITSMIYSRYRNITV